MIRVLHGRRCEDQSLFGFDGLAESARTDACHVSTDRKVSSVGTIWDRLATEAVSLFGIRKYCGRIWPAYDERIAALFADITGRVGRDAIFPDPEPRLASHLPGGV